MRSVRKTAKISQELGPPKIESKHRQPKHNIRVSKKFTWLSRHHILQDERRNSKYIKSLALFTWWLLHAWWFLSMPTSWVYKAKSVKSHRVEKITSIYPFCSLLISSYRKLWIWPACGVFAGSNFAFFAVFGLINAFNSSAFWFTHSYFYTRLRSFQYQNTIELKFQLNRCQKIKSKQQKIITFSQLQKLVDAKYEWPSISKNQQLPVIAFFLLLKNHIFIARSEDTIFIFHVWGYRCRHGY